MTVQNAMLDLQAAVNAIVVKARSLHDGIPETVVVVGASGSTRQGQSYGHFMPRSWKLRKGEDLYGEIVLAGEGLKKGALEALSTILHELTHAYCHANDIKDTSNGNRYHNSKFKEHAEKFGLKVEKADTIGWSLDSPTTATQEIYKEELERLDAAIQTHRLDFAERKAAGDEDDKPSQKKRKMQCPECKEPLLVTKKFWELQGSGGGDYEVGMGIICGTHGVDYEIFEEGGDDS